MPSSSPKLCVDDVGMTFKTPTGVFHALAPVTLSIPQGRFVSLIGPSGCGKTTIFNIIAGLLEPTGGRVMIDGVDATGTIGRVGYMLQKDLLLPWRTVLDNTILGMEIQGVPLREARARALPLLQRYGLTGFEYLYPNSLSGGMRQRAALLRTLLFDTDLILLDEPFGALDAQTKLQMQEWLMQLWSDFGKTVLFVTHDVEEPTRATSWAPGRAASSPRSRLRCRARAHHRRRLDRHQLHLPLDHFRFRHRHDSGLAVGAVVLVVAQLRGHRPALRDLPGVDPEARARAAHHPGVRHRPRLQGRGRDRAHARGLHAHRLCRRQGARSRWREAVLFARRQPDAGVPQAGRAVLPALDHLGAAGEYRPRAHRRDRRRVHRLAARPRAGHPLCRPDLRHRARLGCGARSLDPCHHHVCRGVVARERAAQGRAAMMPTRNINETARTS